MYRRVEARGHLHGGGRGLVGEQVADEARQAVLGRRQERLQLRALRRGIPLVLPHHVQHLNGQQMQLCAPSGLPSANQPGNHPLQPQQ